MARLHYPGHRIREPSAMPLPDAQISWISIVTLSDTVSRSGNMAAVTRVLPVLSPPAVRRRPSGLRAGGADEEAQQRKPRGATKRCLRVLGSSMCFFYSFHILDIRLAAALSSFFQPLGLPLGLSDMEAGGVWAFPMSIPRTVVLLRRPDWTLGCGSVNRCSDPRK
ncbi:hypothetical protein LZ30DRAFT_27059 [Colletotrichum cereale]|nr:hypothetical protein LZ30DRAFT_27059 [Colletotrichum cereale]